MGPKTKPPMANDAIDPTDSTFEDHWDKIEIKLNEWVKLSLLGLVTSITQSHVTKIVDDYISSTEFQRSLADSINFDAAGLETQLGSLEKKLNELINSNQAKIAKLNEELTKLKNNLALKDTAIAGLEDDNYRLSQEADDLEQYTRRTNVRIYGIAEQPEENTDNLAVDFFKSELNVDVASHDISRSHRVGKKSEPNEDLLLCGLLSIILKLLSCLTAVCSRNVNIHSTFKRI